MIKSLLFITAISYTSTAFSQDIKTASPSTTNAIAKQTGIIFFHGTWEELLKESKKMGKPVFIDAYAAWCGPCRLMAANTFTDEEVGKFFNENFVNYKLDMEKGEGPSLDIKYRVSQYPTYLFVDSQGNLKYRKVGYMVPEVFIQEAKKAVQSFKSTN